MSPCPYHNLACYSSQNTAIISTKSSRFLYEGLGVFPGKKPWIEWLEKGEGETGRKSYVNILGGFLQNFILYC